MGNGPTERGESPFKAMSAQDYIAQRVDQFQNWYDGKAITAKSRYLAIRVTAVVGSVVVPVVANVITDPNYARLATTIVSLIVSIAVGLDSVLHYGEQWKNYRSTEQFLSREKYLFGTGEGPYKDMDAQQAFLLLVERCEGQIAAENSATLNVIAVAAQQPDASGKSG